MLEPGETAEQAARREASEEAGLEVGPMTALRRDTDYHTFASLTDAEREPSLDDGELDDWQWASPSEPPLPLHPGLSPVLARIAQDAEFNEGDHPRGQPDNAGQFGPGGGGGQAAAEPAKAEAPALEAPSRSAGRGTGSAAFAKTMQPAVYNAKTKSFEPAGGGSLPKHIASIKIPPAWSNVRFNTAPGADLLVSGKDSKGRTVGIRSDAATAKSAATKYARTAELDAKFDRIMAQHEANKRDPAKRDVSDALDLVIKTGMRPGSGRDTGAEHQGYGATTLEGRHVRVSPSGDVSLNYVPGKKHGETITTPVRDAALAKMLIRRKAAAGQTGLLFGVNANELRAHVKTLDGGGFKTKDFRTHLGTKTAKQMVASMPKPRNEKEHLAAVKQVAKKVADTLGNTPAIALQSYINPNVFVPWH
jgi:DNA topoisomerase-1